MNISGLSREEAEKKQIKFGQNVLPEESRIPAFWIFFSQFKNPLVYILILAAMVSLFLRKYVDIGLIFLVVFINALMGFFQENKTQKTLSALKKLIKPKAKVFRDNQKREVEASELVPKDICQVSSGDRIPADCRVLESARFFVNEAILTGESEPLKKQKGDEVFMGTIVVSGRATLLVEKIGTKTKIGDIAKTLKETEQPETILQIRLRNLTHTLIYISIFLSLLIFLFGFFTGRNLWEMAELSSILLVAIIPEALLIVITMVLVLAMRNSLKKKALIRKILAIETLGSVTTVCTDKTGTLTEGIMKVSELKLFSEENCYLTMSLCNDQNDTLEIALWEKVKEINPFDLEKIRKDWKRIDETPFESQHKFMSTLNKNHREIYLFVKGAPEEIIKMCQKQEQTDKILESIDLWAKKGLKVIACASKKIKDKNKREIVESDFQNLSLNGIIGLWDPPRKEVRESLKKARESGLKIKVLTGDHALTAEKILEDLDLKIKPNQLLEGEEIEKMDNEKFKKIVKKIVLFARVTPEQKLKIIQELQNSGEIIAMMGDGVNDAPALKKSNIGIVVGDASEVAKETADLVLLDNNFQTVISAVEGGRLVFENIKKIVLFILSNSFAEVIAILGALLLGWPLPLTIAQILWLHLLCDGPEDFILGFEPKEEETMLEGPKNINEPLLDRMGIFIIAAVSFLSGIISLGFFWYFGIKQDNLILGQTMAFMSLAFSSVVYIFSCRTLRKPFWEYKNFWANKWLFMVVLVSLFLAFIITYLPLTQRILGLVPLGMFEWSLLVFKALFLVFVIEIAKSFFKNKDILPKNKAIF